MDADAAAAPPSPGSSKADALHALVSGPLSSSAARLAAVSRAIPSSKDFHFYNNFPEFRQPSRDVAARSKSSLGSLASSPSLWGGRPPADFPDDLDDAYDWLVNLNDELLEKFGASMDEFKSLREKQEENGGRAVLEDGGFQMVSGKKRGRGGGGVGSAVGVHGDSKRNESCVAGAGVKVALRDKNATSQRPKVPFHIPTIPRPQMEFSIIVNNSNQPFEHVWLERSEDGTRFVHPLERISVLSFVDRNVGEGDPAKPLPVESTPFKLVEGVKELKELSFKLRDVNEFAVDLEHNSYRSFQGLTCLMQISTREEDFIVDTLKLRIHVGPYLREVFKDPSKRKVMHGADYDILWLQRDFGIYVCNLFDTGQASKVLQLERNSLEYLLHHFCEVTANKEYQNADWRLRPLPEEMLKYAREDTHYLLHIYDLMKRRLIVASTNENDLLMEIYNRSCEICLQLYEKEVLTDTSYLYVYGLRQADFNSKQLSIASALHEWRDSMARAEDESTGYILPNKALLEIARHMPVSSSKLRRLLRSKHPYVERSLNSVVSIIRRAIENSVAFECVSEQLKMMMQSESAEQNLEAGDHKPMPISSEDPTDATTTEADVSAANTHRDMLSNKEHVAALVDSTSDQAVISDNGRTARHLEIALTPNKENLDQPKFEAKAAAVQISTKSSGAFGALFGTSSSRKVNLDKGCTNEQVKNDSKVEQIKSSLVLPFHPFYGFKTSEQNAQEKNEQPQPETLQQQCSWPTENTEPEEIIPLENESDNSESFHESPSTEDATKHSELSPHPPENSSNLDIQQKTTTEDDLMSLSDLSAGFEACFKSISERRGIKQNHKPAQDAGIGLNLSPFDYAAARRNIKFGEDQNKGRAEADEAKKNPDYQGGHRGSATAHGKERVRELQQPRRRQAFPTSGNRSATFH